MTKEEENLEGFPLINSLENQILMHRDAHFGGSFDVMLEYYENEGKGVFPDFNLTNIQNLDVLERQMQQNLSGVFLSGAEAEAVSKAKDAYKKLRDLYQHPTEKNRHARLLADLILSEEEDPEAEIAAIAAEKSAIVPALLHLLKSEDFHDPLFPGYGHAPALAAKCLGHVGDKRSIISLFEAIGESDFFDDEICFEALKAIGAPAKEFLLKVIQGRHINFDNERAASALIYFKDDLEVSKTCLNLLKEPNVRQHLNFATYLALACEELPEEDRVLFNQIANDPNTPSSLRNDMKVISRTWNH